MQRWLLRVVGLAVLVVLFGAVFAATQSLRESEKSNAELKRFLFSQPTQVSCKDSFGRLQAFDPVFVQGTDEAWRQIGYVHPSHQLGDNSVRLVWYDEAIDGGECQFFQYHDNSRLQNVAATMFPPEKQERIKQRIADAVARHSKEITKAFVPLVRESLQASLPVIEEEFRNSVARHRDEIDRLAKTWNEEIVDKRLIPLARKEIVPIVRLHGQPVAEDIGREIWDRASIWRFGWRALYDRTPLPEKNLLRREWERFAKDEAIPIVEKHMEDIVQAVQKTLKDITSNRAVRAELSGVADDLVQDPKTRAIVRTILRESLTDNARLRKVLADVWTTQEAKAALQMAGERIEPVVRQIGDEIFGNEEIGIDPGFARALRTQILDKDRRFIVAYHLGIESDKQILVADKSLPFPVVYLAKQEPQTNP